MIAEKLAQAVEILKEKKIDLWLTFVRETEVIPDPAYDYFGNSMIVWQAAFLVSARGDKIAVMGQYDTENFKRMGVYDKIIGYHQDFAPFLLEELKRLDPKTIAINYSPDNNLSDGLTYGMFLLLDKALQRTPYRDRLISADPVISALRGRKLPGEVAKIKEAIKITEKIWQELLGWLKAGVTEKEVDTFVAERSKAYGAPKSFAPIITHGDKSPVGHVGPTDAKLEPGDIFHIDFGHRVDGFCSDIQRLAYFLKPGEKEPPAAVKKGFEAVSDTILKSKEALKPGAVGAEIDDLARKVIKSHGFPGYQHALGHQLGRAVHDGGTLLGPRWERYGQTPYGKVEKDNVFTLELEVQIPGAGWVSLEEDLLVTQNGAEFLSTPQLDWFYLK
ncbi:MAG: Xaa-Pro peptidase family protein [candidate division Zixibacteria bacterium]|nr:Xaa-Pro peptidase family protein [candidate division Zixibacteria bacterium]MCI0596088.1 Xaa-Pro peptidase family protein [candidate division Zixibacteria bacterium]